MGDNGSKDFRTHKKEREKRFHEAISDGGLTPEGVILSVMRGEKHKVGKTEEEFSERQYQAAKDLLPYRLPRLNSIDAVQQVVGLTHEEFLKLCDEYETDQPEGNDDD